jgi:hypothetical protein
MKYIVIICLLGVVSRINFTHITIFAHRTRSFLEAIGTRTRYTVHRNRGSCEV